MTLFGFSEFDFYDVYMSTFEKIELGGMKKLLPLHAMAEDFGLVRKKLAMVRATAMWVLNIVIIRQTHCF